MHHAKAKECPKPFDDSIWLDSCTLVLALAELKPTGFKGHKSLMTNPLFEILTKQPNSSTPSTKIPPKKVNRPTKQCPITFNLHKMKEENFVGSSL